MGWLGDLGRNLRDGVTWLFDFPFNFASDRYKKKVSKKYFRKEGFDPITTGSISQINSKIREIISTKADIKGNLKRAMFILNELIYAIEQIKRNPNVNSSKYERQATLKAKLVVDQSIDLLNEKEPTFVEFDNSLPEWHHNKKIWPVVRKAEALLQVISGSLPDDTHAAKNALTGFRLVVQNAHDSVTKISKSMYGRAPNTERGNGPPSEEMKAVLNVIGDWGKE